MQVSRRMFLGAMGAAAGFRAFGAPRKGKPELKLALLSDPHVQDAATQAKIRKIFEYARANGVDGVLIAGDIANDGRDDQLKMVADAWFEVFPNSKGADGERVEVGPGDTLAFPSNSPHGTLCLEPGTLLDIFTPMREDFVK